MAELEIHHEHEHDADPVGKKVGIQAAVLAVLLAVVTIASHRTHTEAIMDKAAANDRWSQYQSSRLKFHNLELGESLIKLMAPKGEATDAALKDYGEQKQKYTHQAKEIMGEAKESDEKAEAAEHRGLRFDLGEGFLEIGLVLSSLYFIARKMMFPVCGGIAALSGVVIAVTGILMK